MARDRKLQIERLEGGGGTLLRMSGAIDADLVSAGTEVVTNVGAALVVDFAGVERITSFGVREWSRLLGRVHAGWIGFMNCRPIVVAQFNSIADFGLHGQIVSLFVPYVCEACGHECEQLIDLREQFDVAAADETPKIKCPECGEDAELDDLPDNYFSFVRAQGRPRVPAVAARIIAGKLDGSGPPFHIDKEIDGNLTALWLTGSLDGRARLKRVLDGIMGAAVVEMGGLAFLDKDGAAKLRDTLRAAGEELEPHLARVRATHLGAVYGDHVDELPGSLVSLVAEAVCASCENMMRVEVSASSLDKGQRNFICNGCHAEGPVELAQDVVELALAVRCSDVPREVAQYLESHLLGDRPSDRSKSGGTPQPTSSNYRIIQRIGRGGMAEVFLASKEGIEGFEKRVVLKRMIAALSTKEEFAQMFLQEARIAARINHPNVVQIYDLGFEEGQYFISMEYVRGWDLAIIAKAARRLGVQVPIAVCCRLVADLCAGLYAAHTCRDEAGHTIGIVHRDVSPHNILLSIEGVVKLTDFGISKIDDSSVRTQTGLVKGKVSYMAPEQLDSAIGVVDHRVDLYQAGVVLAELIIGFSPFRLDSDLKSLNAVVRGEIPDLARARPDMPAEVETITRKALALRPTDRYQTARELQSELEAALLRIENKPVTTETVAAWIADLAATAQQHRQMSPPSFASSGNRGDDYEASKTEIIGGSKNS